MTAMGLQQALHLPVTTSADIQIAQSIGIFVIPSTGMRGFKLITERTDEGMSSMVISL